MNTEVDLGLSRYSDLAFTWSVIVLLLAMLMLAVELASSRVRRVEERELVAAGPASLRSADLDRPGVVVQAPVTPMAERVGKAGLGLVYLGIALLFACIVLRGLATARAPWGNMYEFSLAWTFGILAVFLVVSLRRDIRWLGLPVVFLSILSLGLAVTLLYTEAAQLVPALRSWWLIIHVAAAVICGGAFSVAAAISALYLWRERAERKGHVTGIVASLPDASRLDTLAYRILAFAFPLWTFAVISGAIWAEYAWGRYWGWDPKETWAFITWVIYAGYLHARSTSGWRGRRAAYISILGFVSFLINYFCVNIFVNSLHSYAGL